MKRLSFSDRKLSEGKHFPRQAKCCVQASTPTLFFLEPQERAAQSHGVNHITLASQPTLLQLFSVDPKAQIGLDGHLESTTSYLNQK